MTHGIARTQLSREPPHPVLGGLDRTIRAPVRVSARPIMHRAKWKIGSLHHMTHPSSQPLQSPTTS